MNRDDAEFDPPLPRPGRCPGAETLADFAAGSLPPGEAARIRSHIAACGICDSLVERLRHFDEPVGVGPPGWAATERRLRSRVFPKPRWQVILLHPAVAYGIALAAVIVAAVPGRHPASPIPPAAAAIAMESVRTIDLNVTRGVPSFAPDQSEKFLLLSFLIDIHPALHYAVSLDGSPAREVVSSDGKGNFAVLFSRAVLGAGSHRLTVIETDPRSGKTERSLEFPFQL